MVVLTKGGLLTESGYGLRTGLWPRQSSHMQQKRYRRQPRQSSLLKPILSKP